MFQPCPICKGTGIKLVSIAAETRPICDVCNGHKIISEVTGLPPITATPTQNAPTTDYHSQETLDNWKKQLEENPAGMTSNANINGQNNYLIC